MLDEGVHDEYARYYSLVIAKQESADRGETCQGENARLFD
jgi:hypothetical protein